MWRLAVFPIDHDSSKTRVILLKSAAAVITFAFNKDQQVVKQLASGEWEVTEMTVNGISLPDTSYSGTNYTFEKCKVSKGACDGVMSAPDPTKGSIDFPFTYTISDDGQMITITMDVFGFPSVESYHIIEHSKSKFIWETTQDGEEVQTTIEKI
jgi:hypothetical protein